MCYYYGRKVTKAEFDRLMEQERLVAFLHDGYVIEKAFDCGELPVIRAIAGTKETEQVDMEWGFLPPYLKNREAVKQFRFGYKDESGKFHKGYTTFNATSEELLSKMFKDAALHRRCLIPSNGFYEWRHVQVIGKSGKLLKTPEKFPYLIQMREQPEFYMAGVWQPWTDQDTQQTVNTFSLVTTEANTLMKQIHNSKERMPTILPGDLAKAWLYNDLTDDNIRDIANYQVASIEMIATPLDKEFLKNKDPHQPKIYQEVEELVYQ